MKVNVPLIKEKCKERGISIARFEKLADLSNASVAAWEVAPQVPRADSLKKAANFLGVTMEELLIDDENVGK